MRQVVYCSYLLVGVSWLFPPALLVTIPIAVVATIIAGVATVTARAVQAGQANQPQPSSEPVATQEPVIDTGGRHPSEMTLDELWHATKPQEGDTD